MTERSVKHESADDAATVAELRAALEHERALLREIFKQAPNFMAVTRGPGHVFEHVNDAFYSLVGKRDLLGKAVRAALPEAEGQGFFELMDSVYRTGEPLVLHSQKVRLQRGDNDVLQERVLDFVYHAVREPDGTISGIVSQGFDVTERTEAEAHVRFQAKLLDTVGEAVTATDISGRILYWNRAAERLYGWSADEAMGRNFLEMAPIEIASDDAQAVVEMLQSGHDWSGEFPSRRKDGSVFPAGGSATAIRDADGRQIGIIGISSDLTERNAMEAQLREAHKLEAVGRLAGGIAHDFNNVLTVIQGNAQDLLHSVDPDVRQSGHEIDSAARRAADLTRQLLAFSRQQVLQPRVLSVSAILRDMEDMLRRLLRTDIELTVRADEKLGAVRADPSQLSRVIMNLAANARDAMPDGGRLDIDLSNIEITAADAVFVSGDVPAGSFVLLRVADTGVGMDEHTLPRIFEPFFTTKSADRGTGLGLATVFGIVKQSGGFITADSQPGKGTMFSVYLPRVATVSDETSPEESAPAATHLSGGETVLLCEDEASVRRIVRTALQRSGYNVLEASSGNEGLEIADSFAGRIDLVLSDVVMPGLAGPDVVRLLRRKRPQMKALLMSGYASPMVLGESSFELDVPFLEKPFTIGELGLKVREVLG